MADLVVVGLTGFVLGILFGRPRRKRVDLYLFPPMPRPGTPDPALPNEAGRLPGAER